MILKSTVNVFLCPDGTDIFQVSWAQGVNENGLFQAHVASWVEGCGHSSQCPTGTAAPSRHAPEEAVTADVGFIGFIRSQGHIIWLN